MECEWYRQGLGRRLKLDLQWSLHLSLCGHLQTPVWTNRLTNINQNMYTHVDTKHSTRLPSVSPQASLISSLLYRVLVGGEGNPWNDSWHDGSQRSAGWAFWYQHSFPWQWTSKAKGFAMISPGWSCRLDLLHWLKLTTLRATCAA